MTSSLAPTSLKIIIPCHNCAKWIPQSLSSLIAQDFDDWTAIIADDASTDGTTDAIKPFLTDPRIRLHTQKTRQYLMGNTLSALDVAAPAPADALTILDGDDMLLPGALSDIWLAHQRGFDVVWTDMEIQGVNGSTGAPLIAEAPVRDQLWCLSQLRSFKGYLLCGLRRDYLEDDSGRPVRAASDLALYFALIERAGMEKTLFIPEKRYWYRVHGGNNCSARRSEQLANNARIRALPPLARQTEFFDYHIRVDAPQKLDLRTMGARIRTTFPRPFSVCVHHEIDVSEAQSWAAYHEHWIAAGVFFTSRPAPPQAPLFDA